MIRSILHDGPIATVASLVAVLVIIAVHDAPRGGGADGARHADAGRAAGWWAAPAGRGARHVPELHRAAHHLRHRRRIRAQRRRRATARSATSAGAVVSTGGAVALCSWTTIVGYGSLLAAQNQALQGFGLMAIIGEVACLLAAIVALPAFLLWRRVRPLDEPLAGRRKRGRQASALRARRTADHQPVGG